VETGARARHGLGATRDETSALTLRGFLVSPDPGIVAGLLRSITAERLLAPVAFMHVAD